MRHLIWIGAAVLVLAGCDRPPAGAPRDGDADAPAARDAAFAHSQTGDLSGYYVPGERIGPADFQLVTLFVGQEPEFRAWEGGERSATFAPVMLDFQAGGAVERILPDTYAISDDRIRMTGTSRAGARIRLDGRLDQGALANARRNLGEGEAPALTAAVTIDGRTFSGVTLAWSGGD